MRSSACLVLVILAIGGSVAADENAWFVPLGLPPRATPRRISGGEALPPLPLPATPLRRSERKREPSPPTLIGKVQWGETGEFTYESGAKTTIADWNLCPADVQQLTTKAGGWFGMRYRSQPVALSSFDGDPVKTPVLLFNGGRTIKLDRTQTDLVRSYVLRGGMLIFDSIAGSPYFYAGAKQILAQAFPEYALRVVPLDHPVYHMLYDVEEVSFPQNLEADVPFLEAVYVGCRLGAIVSRYGLGCGWDDHEVPFLEQAVYYDVESAVKLGINLVAYAVGYADAGREEAKPELFGALDESPPSDEFVFAQIRHGGAWNLHAGGAAALLRRLRHTTSLRVRLKRVAVTPGEEDLSRYPFLFLSGLDDFVFDREAVVALRGFLRNAGTLLINNGLGMQGFDNAVRRELKKILPDAELAPVPLDHPVFASVFDVKQVRYTTAVLREQPDLNVPFLEGITMNGDLRVIYSPFDMECAWLGADHPLARAYEPHSGMQLGINVVMYAMTH